MADFGFKHIYILGYLEKDGQYLMLHRNRRKHPVFPHNWGGICGEKQDGELIWDAMMRILTEETGLHCIKLRYRGIVEYWKSPWDRVRTCIFTIEKWEGELQPEARLGTYRWIPAERVYGKLYPLLWRTDRILLYMIKSKIKLRYLQFCFKEDGSLLRGADLLHTFNDEELKEWDL